MSKNIECLDSTLINWSIIININWYRIININ
jgi:hypothetical protein